MQESRDPEEIVGVLIWNLFLVRSAAIVRDVGGRGNSTPRRRRASIAPHRVPGRPGRVLLVDSERGVILNRPIVTRTRQRDAYGVKSRGDQLPQWEGGLLEFCKPTNPGDADLTL